MRQHTLLLSFLALFTACQNNNDPAYQLLNEIRTEHKIKYLNESARYLEFTDSSGKNNFITQCAKYIPKGEIVDLLNEKVKSFKWDQARLKELRCVKTDTCRSINIGVKSEDWHYIFNVSSPVFDASQKYAIVRIFQSFPDPDESKIEYGGGCVYLFHLSNNKWIELLRDDCINY